MAEQCLIKTLIDLLDFQAEHYANKTIFTVIKDVSQKIDSITYGELAQKGKSLAVNLQKIASPGERALLVYPTGLDFIVAFYGCLYAGIIAVPAYPPRPNQKLSRLESIINNATPVIALTTTSVFLTLETRLAQSPELRQCKWINTDNFSEELAANWRHPQISADSLAFLQYTSGSTGKPKGVMLSHKNVLHNQKIIKKAFRHTDHSIGLGWLPLFHDMGLVGNILQTLYMGGTCFLMSQMDFLQKPSRWLQAISFYKATTSGGPSFAYDFCLQKITPEQRQTLDLSSWEVAFCGAEPIRGETLEKFAQTFEACGFRREALYPCYGMAEATLFISGGLKSGDSMMQAVNKSALEKNQVIPLEVGEIGQKLVSCGKTLFDDQVIIVDPNSLAVCSEGQVGEIWFSSLSVAQGYWNRTDETQQSFQNYVKDFPETPFLRTGDLGFLLKGDLYITGRLKDVIIIRGQNHYAQDIELTVEKSHVGLKPNAGAAFVVDINDEDRLIIVQEVERNAQKHFKIDEIIDNIRQAVTSQHGLQVYKINLVKPGSMYKTSSGKTQRHLCRQAFVDNTLAIIDI